MSTKLGQETMAYDKVTVPRPLSVATPMTFKLPLTRQKRYNKFIIFFMLERQLILRTFGAGGDETMIISTLPPDVRCYVDLYLPPLCSRYADLALSPDKWFVQLLAKKDKTRSRAKSQCGADLVPFAELKRIVANNYKEMDDETKALLRTWPIGSVHVTAYGRPMTPARRRTNDQIRGHKRILRVEVTTTPTRVFSH